jgi:hypothetical protein
MQRPTKTSFPRVLLSTPRRARATAFNAGSVDIANSVHIRGLQVAHLVGDNHMVGQGGIGQS